MRRFRVSFTPESQRPFGSSSSDESDELPNPPPIGGGEGGGGGAGGAVVDIPTMNEALSYLVEVRSALNDQREKYDSFVVVLRDFMFGRIDTISVIARLTQLFEGHPSLLLGLNTFLPQGYEVTVINKEEAPAKRTVEFEEAMNFVDKIKERFLNNDRVYKSFLHILNTHRTEQKGIKEIQEEVAKLFEGHADLLDEFNRFIKGRIV